MPRSASEPPVSLQDAHSPLASGTSSTSTPQPVFRSARYATATPAPSAASSARASMSPFQRLDEAIAHYPILNRIEAATGIHKLYVTLATVAAAVLLVFYGVGVGVVAWVIGFLYPLLMSIKTVERARSYIQRTRLTTETSTAVLISKSTSARQSVEHSVDGSDIDEDDAEHDDIVGALDYDRHVTSRRGDQRRRHRHRRHEPREIVELRQWVVYWLVYAIFTLIESASDSFLSWVPLYHPCKLGLLLWCFLPQFNGAQTIYTAILKPLLKRHQQTIDEGIDHAQAITEEAVVETYHQTRKASIQYAEMVGAVGSEIFSKIQKVLPSPHNEGQAAVEQQLEGQRSSAKPVDGEADDDDDVSELDGPGADTSSNVADVNIERVPVVAQVAAPANTMRARRR